MAARAPPCRVLLGKGLQQGGSGAQLLQLPNPATGQVQQHLLTPSGLLLELNRSKARYSAWFVGEAVVSDGGAYLATPVDPLFVVLAALDPTLDPTPAAAAGAAADGGSSGNGASSSSHMFVDVPTLLSSRDQWPGLAELAPALGEGGSQLGCICDVKDACGETFYRFSTEKALMWMCCKLRQAVAALHTAGQSSIAGMAEADQQAYALGLLGEYLSPKWAAALAQRAGVQPLGIPGASATPSVRQASTSGAGGGGGSSQASSDKRPKMDPKEAARLKAEAARAEAKAAKLAKEAKGTKAITSFFKAKVAAPKPS